MPSERVQVLSERTSPCPATWRQTIESAERSLNTESRSKEALLNIVNLEVEYDNFRSLGATLLEHYAFSMPSIWSLADFQVQANV